MNYFQALDARCSELVQGHREIWSSFVCELGNTINRFADAISELESAIDVNNPTYYL